MIFHLFTNISILFYNLLRVWSKAVDDSNQSITNFWS